VGFLSRDREEAGPAAEADAEQKRLERQQQTERKDEISLRDIPTTIEGLEAASLAQLAQAFLLGFYAAGTKGEKSGREIVWVVSAVADTSLTPSETRAVATRVVNEAFQLLELNRYLYRFRDNPNTGYEQWFLTRRGQAAVAAGRADIAE
jgi:hypothetical protein